MSDQETKKRKRRKRQVEATIQIKLSKAEMAVLKMIAEGLTSREIAKKLGCSPRTVSSHRYNMRGKLGVVGGDIMLLNKAVELGFLRCPCERMQ